MHKLSVTPAELQTGPADNLQSHLPLPLPPSGCTHSRASWLPSYTSYRDVRKEDPFRGVVGAGGEAPDALKTRADELQQQMLTIHPCMLDNSLQAA